MAYMFSMCASLEAVDLSAFSTGNVDDFSGMFFLCGIRSLDISNFVFSPTANVTSFAHGAIQITRLNAGNNDFSAIADDKKANAFNGVGTQKHPVVLSVGPEFDKSVLGEPTDGVYQWLGGYFQLEAVIPVAVLSGTPTDRTLTFTMASNATVDNVVTFELPDGNSAPAWLGDNNPEELEMDETITKVVFEPSFAQVRLKNTKGLFYSLSKLTAIEGMEYLNTSEATDMTAMFFYCSSLTTIDLSHFSTASAEFLNGLFYGCSGLTSLDLSHFDLSSTELHVTQMLAGCSSLKELNLGDNDLKAILDYNKQYAFQSVGTPSAPVLLTVGDGFDKTVLGEPDAKGNYSWLSGTFRLNTSSGISSTSAASTPSSAFPRYNLRGQRVGNDYRGVVIENGKKITTNNSHNR